MDDYPIPVYIINLKERLDRKAHILNEFKDRSEFQIHLFEAIHDPVGAVGLWKSIREIIKLAKQQEEDIVIICEDDHQFTAAYEYEAFVKNIELGAELGANILLGGVTGGFSNTLRITESLHWLDGFWGTQFVIVYRHFYDRILDEEFDQTVVADGKLSEMTANKFTFYPMISIQKAFGYSDIRDTGRDSERLPALIAAVDDRMVRINEAYDRLSPFI